MTKLLKRVKSRTEAAKLSRRLTSVFETKQQILTGTVAGRNLVYANGRAIPVDGIAARSATPADDPHAPQPEFPRQVVDFTNDGLFSYVSGAHSGGGGGGGGGELVAHALGGAYHTGVLSDSQAPQFLMKDGTRSLTGNLAVSAGVTIDGTDISVHVANPNAHHNQIHAITGSDHTLTAAKWSLVGATATNTLGLIAPSAAPGAAEAVLKSDASGMLTLPIFTATTRLRSPLLDTAAGHLTLAPASNLLFSPADNVVLLDGRRLTGTAGFVSGFAGYGYELLYAGSKAHMEVDNLTVRGRMSVYELMINRIRGTNGALFVTDMAKAKTVELIGGGSYRIYFDQEITCGFYEGDLIRAQKWTGTTPNPLYQCNMQVTDIQATYFTADLISGNEPAAGMEFARLGSATEADRRGSIYMTSSDNYAPYLDVVADIASFADWNSPGHVRMRLGKLDGLSLPGSYTEEFGFWAGDGVSTASQYTRISNKGILLNNVPFSMYNDAVETVHVGAWNDVWLGSNSANKKLTWNGSTLGIVGSITITSGTGFANLDIPNALKTPTGAGLYLTPTELGYWDGDEWLVHIDNTAGYEGDFIFKDAGAANGNTRLRYDSSAGKLGGELYNTAFTPPGWKYTWWADANSGTFYAGSAGEVLLHNYGVSLISYRTNEPEVLDNTKSLAFFDNATDARSNVGVAKARIWGGSDVYGDSYGSPADIKSMLQLEIGQGAAGYISSINPPHISLLYMPEMATSYSDNWLEMRGFNNIIIAADSDAGQGKINLDAAVTAVFGDLQPYSITPHSSGTKVIGDSTHKFEDLYVKRLHADTMLAPTFVGENTVGAQVSLSSVSIPGELLYSWTEDKDDSNFYSGGANDRLSADQEGWYHVFFSLISSTQSDPDIWIAAGNSNLVLFSGKATGANNSGSIGGPVYLTAGSFVRAFTTNPGSAGISARFYLIRSGTMGATPTTSIWSSSTGMAIQSNLGTDTVLAVENIGAGSMTLHVYGDVIADSFNGTSISSLVTDVSAAATTADVEAVYLSKAQAAELYATEAYVNNAVNTITGGGLSHSALANLTADDHTQYVHISTARTITAVHTFNPASATAPFILGANGQGQMVTGLNADYLDGHHWSEVAVSAAEILARVLTVDGSGSGLDADLLDGHDGAYFAYAATNVSAGAGLTGGGSLGTPFSIALGTPGTLTATSTNTATGNHVHTIDATIARSAITLTAAGGLTGGGDWTTNRSIAVGTGIGITVNSDDVAVDTGYAFTWTGAHTFQSTLTTRHILPELTDTYDIGTSVKLWRKGWLSELDAILFAQNTITLVGGWVLLSKGEGKLTADVTDSQTTIDLGSTASVEQHDFILFRSSLQMEYMQVGALVSGTTWNVTRNKDGSGANAWPAGSVFVNLGYTGNGRIELNAYDTPRLSIVTQGSTYNAQTEVIRLGDLNGMTGVTSQKWGIHIGDDTQYLRYVDGVLTVAGVVNILSGSVPAGSVTGLGALATKSSVDLSTAEVTNKSLANVDSAANTKLTGIAAGATVGATWGTNLNSIPAQLGAPTGSGLFLSSTNMGYYASGAWKTYMDSSGNLVLGDVGSTAGLSWNQGTGVLAVKGAITATSGEIAGALTIGASGYITAGNTTINSSGIKIATSTAWGTSYGYNLTSGGTILAGVYGRVITGSPDTSYLSLLNNTTDETTVIVSGNNVTTAIRALSTTGATGIYLAASNSGGGASIQAIRGTTTTEVNLGVGTGNGIFVTNDGTTKTVQVTATLVNLSATSIYALGTLYGSGSANGDLTLEGTSHATKTSSCVILQPTSGNVGIGTAAPTGKLTIKQADHAWKAGLVLEDHGTTNNWQIMYDASDELGFAYNNSFKMTLLSNGNVGIGTAAPNSVVEVSASGGSYWTGSSWNGTVSPAQALTITNSNAGGYDPVIIGRMTTSTGVFKPAFALGMVGTSSWVNATASTQVGDLYIVTRNNADALVERMRIMSTGNVGIGTTAPNYKLVVSNNGATGLEINPLSATVQFLSYNRATGAYKDIDFYATYYYFNAANLWAAFDVSALTFTDRTSSYKGDAIADLDSIQVTPERSIDKRTLPRQLINETTEHKTDNKGRKIVVTTEGRNLSYTVDMLVLAAKELVMENQLLKARVTELEAKLN